MTENEIRSRIYILVDAYTKDVKIKEKDKATINAGIDLLVNFFECLNRIASNPN
jgi:hypothetical protein